jgi:putative peptide zinc metalloprotease protein
VVQFAPGVATRLSKRGLVIAADGDTVLLEHPRASEFSEFLDDDPHPDELLGRLGPPVSPTLVDDLVDIGILVDPETSTVRDCSDETSSPRRVKFSRSGIMISGIATPARWINRCLVPVLVSWPGRIVIVAVVIAGVAVLLAGRPALPAVSSSPALEALLMVAIGMAGTFCHELAHAVALVHYGRTPQRAGFGFYWGALSFYVDSTPALTLPRRARVVQALIGLAVDVVAVAAFAILAVALTNSSQLLAIVFWRLAILGLAELLLNLLPVLQVDGHWALADWLDEPDLSPRARRALGTLLRGRRPTEGIWMGVYGAISLLAGLAILTTLTLVFWSTTGDLVIALFTGNIADILIGVYYVVPLALGVLFSAIGLILEALSQDF